VASVCYNLGLVYRDIGNYNQAIALYNQALNIYYSQSKPNLIKIIDLLFSLGMVYGSQGELHKGIDLMEYCLNLLNNLDKDTDQRGEIAQLHLRTIDNLAVYYGKVENYNKLSSLIDRILLLYDKAKFSNPIELAGFYSRLSNSYILLYRVNEAEQTIWQAIQLAQDNQFDSTIYVANYYHNLANVYRLKREYSEAMNYVIRSKLIKDKYSEKQIADLSSYYNLTGTIWLDLRKYDFAIQAFDTLLQLQLNGYRMRDYSLVGNSKAEALAEGLVPIAQMLVSRRGPGDDTFALATVRFADRFIDSLRRAYTYENDKLELGKDANQLYQVAIDVAKWNKLDEEAFYYSEKNKAAVLAQSLNEATAFKLGGIPDSLIEKDKELRTLVTFYTKASIDEELNCPKCDSTKLSNLKNGLFTHQQQHTALKSRLENEFPQYFALKYKDAKISVKEVQQGFLAENPNSAILEYLLGDSVLYAFCITKDKYAFHRQKLDSTRFKNTNALQLEIKKLGRSLADVNLYLDPTTVVSQPASILYDYLIKPFEAQISGKDLVIIPDAELNKIPFEMLMEPHPNLKNIQKWQELPYLIKSHNISYHYSAHLLLEDWQKGKTQPVKSSGFVAFAPVFDDTSTGKIVSNENVIEQSYLTSRPLS
jgi:tetratricopeptide (TPR) repeat protein